jgi:hypothetical protein
MNKQKPNDDLQHALTECSVMRARVAFFRAALEPNDAVRRVSSDAEVLAAATARHSLAANAAHGRLLDGANALLTSQDVMGSQDADVVLARLTHLVEAMGEVEDADTRQIKDLTDLLTGYRLDLSRDEDSRPLGITGMTDAEIRERFWRGQRERRAVTERQIAELLGRVAYFRSALAELAGKAPDEATGHTDEGLHHQAKQAQDAAWGAYALAKVMDELDEPAREGYPVLLEAVELLRRLASEAKGAEREVMRLQDSQYLLRRGIIEMVGLDNLPRATLSDEALMQAGINAAAATKRELGWLTHLHDTLVALGVPPLQGWAVGRAAAEQLRIWHAGIQKLQRELNDAEATFKCVDRVLKAKVAELCGMPPDASEGDVLTAFDEHCRVITVLRAVSAAQART